MAWHDGVMPDTYVRQPVQYALRVFTDCSDVKLPGRSIEMRGFEGFDAEKCLEDCPRCNRCPHTSLRRVHMEGLIQQYELQNLRYETDRLPLAPPTAAEWHILAMQAINS